jgi:hypothetical protein
MKYWRWAVVLLAWPCCTRPGQGDSCNLRGHAHQSRAPRDCGLSFFAGVPPPLRGGEGGIDAGDYAKTGADDQQPAPHGKRSLTPEMQEGLATFVEMATRVRALGSMHGEQVVFPHDRCSLQEAISLCSDIASRGRGQDVGTERENKRTRREEAASEPPNPRGAQDGSNDARAAGKESARTIKKLLVQFGHHEMGEEPLDIRGGGVWSISGLGDLSDQVDFAHLEALVAHMDAAHGQHATIPSGDTCLRSDTSYLRAHMHACTHAHLYTLTGQHNH